MSRTTAAHSTVTIADRSSARISHSRFLGPVIVSGISETEVDRRIDEKRADILTASHDGYGSLGYVHQRELELNEAGTKIRGVTGSGSMRSVNRSQPRPFAVFMFIP